MLKQIFGERSNRKLPSKVELEALYSDRSIPTRHIARYFNLSGEEMYAMIDMYKIPLRSSRRPRITNDERDCIRLDYSIGMSVDAICGKYHRSQTAIKRLTSDLDLNQQLRDAINKSRREREDRKQIIQSRSIVIPTRPSLLQRIIAWFKG